MNATKDGGLESDVWSDRLLHHRHTDDPAYGRVVQTVVAGYADRVLPCFAKAVALERNVRA